MTYLKEVYKKDKKLFFVIFIFIAITLILNYSLREITPFYVYSMFGGRTSKRQIKMVPVFAIRENNGYRSLKTYNNLNEMKFSYTISFYDYLNNNWEKDRLKLDNKLKKLNLYPLRLENYNTIKRLEKYPYWIINKLGYRQKSIKIIKYNLNFIKKEPQLIDSIILIDGNTNEL